MAWEEKRTWLFLGGTLLTYAVYVAVVVSRQGDGALVDVAYGWPLLLSIVISVVVHIVLSILAAVVDPAQADRRDERDDAIDQHGDLYGSYVTSGLLLVVLYAVVDKQPHFWIGNGIYLAFVVGAVVGSIVKVVRYRRGF